MIVVVTGGRDYHDQSAIFGALYQLSRVVAYFTSAARR